MEVRLCDQIRSVVWLQSVGCFCSRWLDLVKESKCGEKVRVRWSDGIPEEVICELCRGFHVNVRFPCVCECVTR